MSGVPPLSQSRQGLMACPRLYLESEVFQNKKPQSVWAERGHEVHQVICDYILHLIEKRVRADWPVFDSLADGVGTDARQLLDNFREHFELDPEKVVGAELYVALDKDFVPLQQNWLNQTPTEYQEAKAFEMTMDYVELAQPNHALIYDWKSYYQVVTADTFQGQLYALGLFCLNPTIEQVTFRLEFLRWGVTREVYYSRGDVPRLAKRVKAERDRQLLFHDPEALAGWTRQAFPGRHCTWCPLLPVKQCPLDNRNPFLLGAEERLAQVVYLRHALAEAEQTLKVQVAETGVPVSYKDANQNEHRAEFILVEQKKFPLYATLPILQDWLATKKDDLFRVLAVSGLRSYLKAKKRQELSARLEEVAEKRPQTNFKVRAVNEEDDDEIT